MKKYNCEYRDGHKLNIGDNWEKKGILASNHKEAYEKFIQEVGLYPKSVTVSSGLLGVWKEFDNDRVTQTGPELSLVWTG